MAKQQLKKNGPRPPAGGRVIDFNALLGNWPQVQIGDRSFEGRHVNQVEKLRWMEAERSDDAAGQHAFVVDALNARGADVDLEWVQQWPDKALVAIVRGLHGFGWPGEEGVEGN